HPNVVNIFDVGVHEDIPYLVMELLEGQDLERLIATRGALPEALIVDIMVPVVAGLIAVHDAGIVHRDLKPGNIFLSRSRYYDLEPKLLDFGISKAAGPDMLKLTTSRTVMGTPLYVCPEGLRGGEMTPASDQYSLGVVMYECATGRTPFPASNFPELSNLIAAGRYTSVNEHKPEISKRLAGIIERAMSLDPSRRYRDLRELGRELLQLAGQRTRITWGLSFGEKQTLSSTPPAHTIDRRNASPVPLPRTARLIAMTALVVFGLAQVVLLGTGVSAWLSGRLSIGGARALFRARPEATVHTSAAARTGVTAAWGLASIAAAGSEVLAPPSAALAPPPEPSDTRGVAALAPSDSPPGAPRREPARTPPPVVTAPPVGAVPAAPADAPPVVARGVAPAPPSGGPATSDRRRAATAPPDPEPEWALPSASAAPAAMPAPPTEGLGANGAPILD
ncbi:MAG: serine/threonine protein kinase, partial [Myxococcales bacterium]|nr:serine/threonine protein kinase [Myxococcales bacterium]